MDMEFQEYKRDQVNSDANEKTQFERKKKTSLRLKYEAESTVIRKKLGSLEDIRKQLGLTQRKMCQLLMVDPSAWTRWQKDESKIPPHIYRALQWYMALIDKAPEWHPSNSYLGAFRSSSKSAERVQGFSEEIDTIQRQLKSTLHHNHLFMEEMRKHTQIHWGWKMIMLINVVILLVNIFF